MPLQNRVTPFGDIMASPARGTMMGNRGGRIHDPATRTLSRRWASRAWIACLLHYKDQHHEPMGQGYTSLFFLDEVTALAAGHRPCFYCRRADATAFLGLAGEGLRAPDLDRLAHRDRLDERRRKRTFASPLDGLPDGAMLVLEGEPYAVAGPLVLHWTFCGYDRSLPRSGIGAVEVLTPRVFVGILAAGYRPAWHRSAGGKMRGERNP